MRRDGPSNNTFYSFGGRKFIRDETDRKDHILNPIFRDYDGNVGTHEAPVIFRKDLNQRVNDYSKNISDTIFSPAVLPPDARTKQAKVNALRHRMRSQEGARRRTASTPQPEIASKLDRFQAKLNEEALKKQMLKKQIDEMRS